MKVYFTYGNEGEYPYNGGWTEISAPTVDMAAALHRGVHPGLIGRNINCANMFMEDTFKSTRMYENQDNHGSACQEYLKITSHCCCAGSTGFWVHTGYLTVYPVIVNKVDKDNPGLVTINVLMDCNDIVSIDNVPIEDIFEEQSDAEAFKQQLLRYINRRVSI